MDFLRASLVKSYCLLLCLLLISPPVFSAPMQVRRVNRDILDQSLAAGRSYMLSQQRPEGNFYYQYNFVKRTFSTGDNQVRQAGSLWGLALLHQDSPAPETRKAVEKGLGFFRKHSRLMPGGGRYIVYPDAGSGKTGAVALVTLALIDFLRAEKQNPRFEQYMEDLSGYLIFLASLRRPDALFHGTYRVSDGEGGGPPSPYSDGETLLAFIKASKYIGFPKYREMALASAEAMHEHWVRRALKQHPDSRNTKGFYQWGSMAFYELYTSGWPGVQSYASRVIDLAYWMIDVHRTLERRKNTAYAYEGIVSAWELARLTKREDAMKKLQDVIEKGLTKLTSWQVGGPMPNAFLRTHENLPKQAIGGVMNSAKNPVLRIDVTQHQMHAVILARRLVYAE